MNKKTLEIWIRIEHNSLDVLFKPNRRSKTFMIDNKIGFERRRIIF